MKENQTNNRLGSLAYALRIHLSFAPACNSPSRFLFLCSSKPLVIKSINTAAILRKPLPNFSSIRQLAVECDLASNQILLGGDHLGPFPWVNEPAESAMQKSAELVRQYVRAGYQKIHLDASVSCMGDPSPLPKELVAEREGLLCKAAVQEIESSGLDLSKLVFVVGTEVPSAGGTPHDHEEIAISSVEETEENIQLTEKAFSYYKVEAAWERTLAFVVQPGVEFSGKGVHAYERQKTRSLSRLIEKYDHLVFEAHSTDYQSRTHLRQLVEDHFAFLKVGPALTHALREGLFALADIETQLCGTNDFKLSNLKQVLDEIMVANPVYWSKYYFGDKQSQAEQRRGSLLDRSRYYLLDPKMEQSVRTLLQNLSGIKLPQSITRHYFQDQFPKVEDGRIKNQPLDLLSGKISDVVEDYIIACFPV